MNVANHAAQSAAEPAAQPGQRPAAQPGQRPAAQPGQRPGEWPAADPGEQPGERPAADSAAHPYERPAADTGEQPDKWPAGLAVARDPGPRTSTREMIAAGTADAGRLILAATPIGRPGDASACLVAALAAAAVIAAEDTRRLRRLTAALGVTPAGRLVSYYEDVEVARGPALLAELAQGRDVLLVTDAGMPGISDPGYRLVTGAIEAGIDVTVLPGPSAVTAALAVSGLPTDRFCFEGFPPRRAGERARRFADLRAERRTLVFFESPRRLGATLADLATAFGPGRKAAVCRELTKTHEEIRRGTLGDLAQWAAPGVLGEITLVVAGAPAPAGTASAADAASRVAALEQAGSLRKEAIAQAARELGLRRREVYDAVVRERNAGALLPARTSPEGLSARGPDPAPAPEARGPDPGTGADGEPS